MLQVAGEVWYVAHAVSGDVGTRTCIACYMYSRSSLI